MNVGFRIDPSKAEGGRSYLVLVDKEAVVDRCQNPLSTLRAGRHVREFFSDSQALPKL